MRKIKFRGKSLKNKKWVYGDLMSNICGTRIVRYKETDDGKSLRADWGYVDVEPDTVGQFTGLTDCNGKEIYEGDILVYGGQYKNVVEFKHGMFGYTLMDGWFVGYGGNTNFTFDPLDKSKEHEVIGNVFDNPELIPNQPKLNEKDNV